MGALPINDHMVGVCVCVCVQVSLTVMFGWNRSSKTAKAASWPEPVGKRGI